MIEKAQTTPGFRLPTLAIHSAITKDAVKITKAFPSVNSLDFAAKYDSMSE